MWRTAGALSLFAIRTAHRWHTAANNNATDMERYDLLDGRLYVFKRPRSRFWQCGTFLHGKKHRESTKQESFGHAKEFAEQWYFDLRSSAAVAASLATPPARPGKTFAEVAPVFTREFQILTQGQRNAKYVKVQESRIKVHLMPFFGPLTLPEITAGKVQEYRMHRIETSPPGKPPARSTIHQEIVALRQILKTALRHAWIAGLPDLSPPYKTSGKIGHRGWFSHEEYRRLYEATRRRAKNPKPPFTTRWQWEAEQLHDFVLFMANTGLRPDEAWNLQLRDVSVEKDEATQETILVIEVRGKRGLGLCKSTANAVRPFRRLCKRNNPQPTDRLFPTKQRELLNAILAEENLKFDRDGNRRTAYSLRHTYICFRLLEGADVYQIAKNCRTSVEMIERHYAVHLKNTLDAAAINVRKSRVHKPRRIKEKHPPGSITKPVG